MELSLYCRYLKEKVLCGLSFFPPRTVDCYIPTTFLEGDIHFNTYLSGYLFIGKQAPVSGAQSQVCSDRKASVFLELWWARVHQFYDRTEQCQAHPMNSLNCIYSKKFLMNKQVPKHLTVPREKTCFSLCIVS